MAPNSDRWKSALLASPCLDLCLDFANTLYGRGSVPTESLHGFDDLVRWCAAKLLVTQAEAEELLVWSDGNREPATAAFAGAVEIRETIYRIFANFAATRDAEPADLSNLNRALAEVPMRGPIARSVEGFVWRTDNDRRTARGLLAPVLWSAGYLLTGRCLERVRLCANHKCLWLFLDDSLGGARRWCSMQACGNRAKTQRHYLRRKAG